MPTTKRKNVLVVDDDQSQRALIRRILEIYQLHVRLAPSGAEAIAMLKESIPDLIIVDMHMPEMNGRETLQQMQTLLGDQLPPVIGLSGAASQGDEQLLGFSDYISKPFSISELGGRLQPYVDIAIENDL